MFAAFFIKTVFLFSLIIGFNGSASQFKRTNYYHEVDDNEETTDPFVSDHDDQNADKVPGDEHHDEDENVDFSNILYVENVNFSYPGSFGLRFWLQDSITGKPTIPYVIRGNAAFKEVVMASMNEWTRDTCVEFQPKRESDSNFVVFSFSPYTDVCFANTGMVGRGPQLVSLTNGCKTLDVVTMFTGQIIGLIPEHRRPDRDEFVIINLENINGSLRRFFDKYPPDAYPFSGVPLDYNSAMFPKGKFLSEHDGLTIVTKDLDYQGLLGRHKGKVSHRNRLLVNTYYNCSKMLMKKCGYRNDPCENEGFLGPDCKCICRPGTQGITCETIIHKSYYGSFLPNCSRVINQESVITSPNFPGLIPPDTWCVYKIRAPLYNRVILNFTKFHIAKPFETCKDSFLEIRFKNKYQGMMVCGISAMGQVFQSRSEDMIMYLDVKNNRSQGFEAQVRFEYVGKQGVDFVSSRANVVRNKRDFEVCLILMVVNLILYRS